MVIADCLRRCGEFAAASDWIERGLAEEIDSPARVQLEFEKSLVGTGDTSAHLVDEARGLAAVRDD